MVRELVEDVPLPSGDADAVDHANTVVSFRHLEEARVRVIAESGPGLTSPSGGLVDR